MLNFTSPERRAKRLIRTTQGIADQCRKAAAALDPAMKKEVKRYNAIKRMEVRVLNAIHTVRAKLYDAFTQMRYRQATKVADLALLQHQTEKLANAYERLLNG